MKNNGLVFLAGAIYPLGFAPFAYYLISIVSLAIFFAQLIEIPPRQALQRGFLFGLGMFGVGVSWLQISIHQFGLPVLAFSILVTFLFIMLLASLPATLSYLSARYYNVDQKIKLLILLPVLWIFFEWIRSWLLTGFPWINLGYSQIDSPLAGFAPVLGVYGVGLVAAFTAGLLAQIVTSRQLSSLLINMLAIALFWGGGHWLNTIEWTQADKSINVAMVQGNIEQSLKWQPEQREKTLALYSDLSEPFWATQDLIVWPETALPAFKHQIPEFIDQIAQKAEVSKADILIGLPVLEAETGKYYNSVLSFGKQTQDSYRKRHLVPFGEYLPLEKFLDPILAFLNIPMSRFSAGDAENAIIKTSKFTIGLSICYEDVFGEEVISSLPAADFLVNVSNDAWFGDSLAPHQHLEMARMRALETHRYMVRVTNTGISAIINPQGKITAQIEQFKADALSAKIVTHQGATPYVRLGNMPMILLLASLLISFLIRVRA